MIKINPIYETNLINEIINKIKNTGYTRRKFYLA